MDPRLKSSLSPHRPSAMQDVRPPAVVAPSSVPTMPTTHAALPHLTTTTQAPSYEIVGSIPMAQPGMPPVATPPPVAAAPSQLAPPPAQPADDDFERILKAVNDRVQTPLQSQPKARGKIAAKLTSKIPKVKPVVKSNRPIGAMVAAVAVVLILSVVAVLAYKQGGKGSVLSNQASKVGTSYQSAASIQAAGGKLVSPGDLDNYSQDLGKKINSLNDSQDFSPEVLSNAVLGL